MLSDINIFYESSSTHENEYETIKEHLHYSSMIESFKGRKWDAWWIFWFAHSCLMSKIFSQTSQNFTLECLKDMGDLNNIEGRNFSSKSNGRLGETLPPTSNLPLLFPFGPLPTILHDFFSPESFNFWFMLYFLQLCLLKKTITSF